MDVARASLVRVSLCWHTAIDAGTLMEMQSSTNIIIGDELNPNFRLATGAKCPAYKAFARIKYA